MNDFQVVDESITTEDMDNMISDMAEKKVEYEAAKQDSDTKHKVYQESRAKVIATLQQAGKTKYHVDGVGTVSVTEKLKVRVPKTPEEKSQFFDWLTRNYGKEGYLTYVGINYQSLQSLYNQEFEQAKLEGTADNFEISGIGNPEHEYGLSFRK